MIIIIIVIKRFTNKVFLPNTFIYDKYLFLYLKILKKACLWFWSLELQQLTNSELLILFPFFLLWRKTIFHHSLKFKDYILEDQD